jgi:hypothetical protein
MNTSIFSRYIMNLLNRETHLTDPEHYLDLLDPETPEECLSRYYTVYSALTEIQHTDIHHELKQYKFIIFKIYDSFTHIFLNELYITYESRESEINDKYLAHVEEGIIDPITLPSEIIPDLQSMIIWIVRFCLMIYPDLVDSENFSLTTCTRLGLSDVVYVLISEFGSNVNQAEPEFHTTPLHKAVEFRHINLVAFLLERGADANVFDSQGCIPLFYAVSGNNSEAVKLLLLYTNYSNIYDVYLYHSQRPPEDDNSIQLTELTELFQEALKHSG